MSLCKLNVLFYCRYIESMVHYASIRHPASILDDLHGKVLNEAYQISKSTVPESVSKLGHVPTCPQICKLLFSAGSKCRSFFFLSNCVLQNTGKPEHKISKADGSFNTPHGQTDLSVKPDNVKIKGLQANVTIPKVCIHTYKCVRVCARERERYCIGMTFLFVCIFAG